MTSLQDCSAQPGREPGWFISVGHGVWIGLGTPLWLRRGSPTYWTNFQCWLCPFCFETFLKGHCGFSFLVGSSVSVEKFSVTFQGLYSVPKGLLEMKVVFFKLNDLTDDQKEYIKTVLWGWQGCQCSLYLWSGLIGLRQCLTNSPWLSLGIGAGETQRGGSRGILML